MVWQFKFSPPGAETIPTTTYDQLLLSAHLEEISEDHRPILYELGSIPEGQGIASK